jgi:hypothetical protein
MRTAPPPEPGGEPPKILLVDLLEDGHHRLLDHLVFQGGEAQRTLSSISLRDVDPQGWLRSIGPVVDSAVEGGVSLQHREAVPEQVDREMVE